MRLEDECRGIAVKLLKAHFRATHPTVAAWKKRLEEMGCVVVGRPHQPALFLPCQAEETGLIYYDSAAGEDEQLRQIVHEAGHYLLYWFAPREIAAFWSADFTKCHPAVAEEVVCSAMEDVVAPYAEGLDRSGRLPLLVGVVIRKYEIVWNYSGVRGIVGGRR